MNNTKKSIFESAIRVFSESGYNGSTMDAVAIGAGVAKGTLYYHFGSKEEIFKFTITEGMNLINEETKTATSLVDNPIDKIKVLCRVELNLLYKNRNFFKVLMSQLWGDQLRQHELRDVIHSYINYIEQYIREAYDGGFIKNGNPSFLAYSLFGTLCSASVYELLNKDELDIEEVIENLMQYILYGMNGSLV